MCTKNTVGQWLEQWLEHGTLSMYLSLPAVRLRAEMAAGLYALHGVEMEHE